jgi:hypothetical protein
MPPVSDAILARGISRDQKIEALGMAITMQRIGFRWIQDGKLLTDQECLDCAVAYQMNPRARPHLPFHVGSGTRWAMSFQTNPYLWRSYGFLRRNFLSTPLGRDYWVQEWKPPGWAVPWLHECGRPDKPL